MTTRWRWLTVFLKAVRVVLTSLLIVLALHVVAAYFGWSLAATAE